MRILLLALLLSPLGACGFIGFPGVYRIDVEQGNIVTRDMVEQLEPGMSRRQVRFLLGTPLVEDPFNPQRWDYAYMKRNGPRVLNESHLTVHFEGDRLVDVSGDHVPPAWGGPTAAAGNPSAEAATGDPGA